MATYIAKSLISDAGGLKQSDEITWKGSKLLPKIELLKVCTILLLMGTFFFPGICAAATPGDNSSHANASISLGSKGIIDANLTNFVEEAVAYAHKNSQDEVIREFNNPNGTFSRNDLYIFAYGFNGTTLAHPYRHDLVGRDNINLTDVNGVPLIKNMISIAERGNGFLYYVWSNPAHDNKDELKLTYVDKVDNAWWLAAGTYLSNISADFSQASRNNLTRFVDSAVKYARENGKDRALKEFNDQNGTFFNGGLYVFAYDFNCSTLAAPTQPHLIGTNRFDFADPNGVRLIRDMSDLAKGGRGFTYYVYPDPTRNMTERLKLSFVEKVDDTWWLGAGIYTQ